MSYAFSRKNRSKMSLLEVINQKVSKEASRRAPGELCHYGPQPNECEKVGSILPYIGEQTSPFFEGLCELGCCYVKCFLFNISREKCSLFMSVQLLGFILNRNI